LLVTVVQHQREYYNNMFCWPGTQSVYVKTWGCSHNNSDSEYMAGQLAAFGYTVTGDFSN